MTKSFDDVAARLGFHVVAIHNPFRGREEYLLQNRDEALALFDHFKGDKWSTPLSVRDPSGTLIQWGDESHAYNAEV